MARKPNYRRRRSIAVRLLAAMPLAASGCHYSCLQPDAPIYPAPPANACEANHIEGDPLAVVDPKAQLPSRAELIDLPTALRLADAQNPEIAIARERIQEALAQQDRANLLWLPNLDFGP